MSGNRWVRASAHVVAMLLGGSAFVVSVGAAGPSVTPAAAAPTEGSQVTVSATATKLGQPADPFLGTVKPSATAATEGMFGPQIRWPAIPLQAVLTPSGRLVTFGSPIGVAAQRGLAYDEWNPALGGSSAAHVQTPSMHDYDSFCSGMQLLPDGRMVMVGGNSTMSTMIFDPTSRVQTAGSPLTDQRWYASTLRLPDNRIVVLGGADYYNTKAYRTPTKNTGVALVPEIGTGTGKWTALSGASSTLAFGAEDNRWWYPRAYNGPRGTVVAISANKVWSLDVRGKGKITSLGSLPTSIGISGSSVMFRPGQVLTAGGGQQTNSDTRTATNAATVIDFRAASTKITKTTAMKTKRNWGNLTVLANGEVLMNGGTVVGTTKGNAAYRAEVYNPDRGTWRTVAAAQRIRTYHSVSLLMPSGAVFTGGGGIPGPEDNMNAEMYYPSYLFSKASDGTVRWANRPKITSLAGDLRYGGRISLGMGDRRVIRSASLTSLAAVTHSYNADQRYVPLKITQGRSGSVSATLPQDPNALPPGSYLLQVVDGKGVPSPAQIVTVKRSGAGQVTLHESTKATGGGESGDTTSVGVVPLTVGSAVSIEPYDQWGFRLRTTSTGAVGTGLTTSVDSLAARRNATFFVRRGLAGDETLSFESAGQAGLFLVVRDGVLSSAVVDASNANEAESASFAATTGLAGQFTSLRLGTEVEGPGSSYLRQQGSSVVAEQSDGSDASRQQSTFAIRPPLAVQDAPTVSSAAKALPSSPSEPSAPSASSASPEPSSSTQATTISAPGAPDGRGGAAPEACCRPEESDSTGESQSGSSCHC